MVTNRQVTPVIRVPIRVRFVGGPWHNLMPLLQEIGPFAGTADGQHRYQLAQFETVKGTLYYQYIHMSLIQGDAVKASVCREYFPRFSINVRQLERRLAGKTPPLRRL